LHRKIEGRSGFFGEFLLNLLIDFVQGFFAITGLDINTAWVNVLIDKLLSIKVVNNSVGSGVISVELDGPLDDRVFEFVPGKAHGTAPNVIIFGGCKSIVFL
jgi:hypothetical protein